MSLGAFLMLCAMAVMWLSWYLYHHTPTNFRDFTVSDWCTFVVAMALGASGGIASFYLLTTDFAKGA